MTDPHAEALEALQSLEAEQIERYRPKPPAPQKPLTPAEEFAKRLDAAQSKSISVDIGWLR